MIKSPVPPLAYHSRVGGLNTRNSFFSQFWELVSEIKVSAGLVFPDALSLACRCLPPPWVLTWPFPSAHHPGLSLHPVSSSFNDISQIGLGPF